MSWSLLSLSSLCFMRAFIGYKLNFYSVLFCFVSFFSLASPALLKTFERCIVKPLGQLVRVSSMAHTTYTPRLSTSSS